MPLTPESAKLEQAALLIAEVAAVLKQEAWECPACHRPAPANVESHAKHTNHEMLAAALTRVRRVAEWFDRQPD